MSPLDRDRPSSALPSTFGTRVLRRVCTGNPFYVLSAALFMAGLKMSFAAQDSELDTWALMAGLTGYTLLLAVTACLLVRFGNVWDDVRTVLLLVVLMFLATSLTFDEVLALDPQRGIICFVVGLLVAVGVSEGILRVARLRLPMPYRVPYYLILSLFFLYPLAIQPLMDEPESETLMWSLFGFSTTAGMALLTLLPAIRRGADTVRDNGSPWSWPLYPWTLFGVFALAVPVRAYLMCLSLHLLGGRYEGGIIFGPYFLVPFGLALSVLLLEAGLASGRRGILGAALLSPLGLIALTLFGHRDEAIYHQFRDLFLSRFGMDPFRLTLFLSACFYLYAVWRRVGFASEALTATLATLSLVGPETVNLGGWNVPRFVPLLAASALQLGLGMWRRRSWRCLLGASGLIAVAAFQMPEGEIASFLYVVFLYHLVLFAFLMIGAFADDRLALALRAVAAILVLLSCSATMGESITDSETIPVLLVALYAPLMGLLLAGYGWVLKHRLSLACASMILTGWAMVTAWEGYYALRQIVAGLDYILMSMALFGVAILVSLFKAGKMPRFSGE